MSLLQTWPLKPTDFTLVAKDGEVLHCHKACLAENSEYFAAMLSHEFYETTNNQMHVPEYDGVTVASFLEWIYAPKNQEEVMKKLKESAQPNEFIFQKQFDMNKFSPALLKMAHLYQLKDLQEDCEEYLERNITKENAVEAWTAAGVSGSQKLKDKALMTIAKNCTKGKASEIPGLKDMDGVDMMEWILRIREEKHHDIIREEDYQVKVEFEDVRLWHETMTFKVTPSEKCSSLKVRAATKIGHFASKLLLFRGSDQMGDKSTLRECGVRSGDTLTIQVPEPLPFHVLVKLEFEFVDFANSKLHGQDTLIFIVDLYTETIGSLLHKVAARLDCSSEEIGMMIRKRNGVTRTYHEYEFLNHMGLESGDCAFKIHKKD